MVVMHESPDGTLRAEKEGRIGRIVFDNEAKRNAVTLAGWAALGEAVAVMDADEDIRVVVVSGAGTRAFVSGSDISEFDSARSEAEAIRRYNAIADGAIARLAAARRPVVAAIRGYCLGGGLAIALSCDIRIATQSAIFGMPAARVGLAYRHQGIAQFLAAVGPAYTSELFMTARRFDATEALHMRLVNRVVAEPDLDGVVADLCAGIALNAPLTIEAVKVAVRELTRPVGEPDVALMEALADRCFASDDYAEGRAAFKARRQPSFRGQ